MNLLILSGILFIVAGIIIYIIKNRTVMCECGHKNKINCEINGREYKLNKVDGKYVYCADCLEKMGIKCAWCGEPINVDDPITIYSPKDKDYSFPEYAVYYDKEKNQVVGCLRESCCFSGADRSGFWIVPGVVERVPSLYESMFNGNMKDYKMFYINNIYDRNDKGTFC